MPRLKEFDRAGVDLAVVEDSGNLSTAIQCKGFFSDRRMSEAQYKQIEQSLDKFIASPIRCGEFVLFHNQTGENVEVTQKIRTKLRELVTSGKAVSTRLWDRQTLARDLRAHLSKMIADRLHKDTAMLLEQVSNVFRFGSVHVSSVPFSTHRLTLVRDTPPEIEWVQNLPSGKITDHIFKRSDSRWTLLTGLFGSGKSVAALHSALATHEIVVFVRCADLEFEHGFGGTNTLLGRAIASLDLFDDYEDEDRKALEIFAGPTLRSALSRPNTRAALILDGLDENRMFSDSAGLTRLVNAIAELRCPIVLTTRQEHFDSTYGNFDQLLDDLAQKRNVRLFKLEPWSRNQTVAFLSAAAASSTGDEQVRLSRLASTVDSGETCKWPEELLSHPLFLQMIAELTAEGEQPSTTMGALLRSWIHRKLMRDLRVPRAVPKAVTNRAAFSDQLMSFMESVAAEMTEKTDEGVQLRETIDSSAVVKIAGKVVGVENIDIATLTGISLLVPITPRLKVNVPMRFSHRAFQEYFTACYALRAGLAVNTLPPPVARLMTELA